MSKTTVQTIIASVVAGLIVFAVTERVRASRENRRKIGDYI